MNSKKQGRLLHIKIKLFNGKKSKLRRNCVVKGAKLTLRLLLSIMSNQSIIRKEKQ